MTVPCGPLPGSSHCPLAAGPPERPRRALSCTTTPGTRGSSMKRRSFLLLVTSASALVGVAQAKSTAVEVFKSPSCGCCGGWVEHLRAAGFAVKVTDVDDTTAARKRLGMPDAFGSCHTASVEGYVLEGHVPARDVRRLLATKPAAIG